MIKQNYSYHTAAATMLFVLGDAVLDMPTKSATEGNFFCFALSIPVAFLVLLIGFLFSKFLNFVFLQKNGFAKALAVPISYVLLMYSVFVLVHFTKFAYSIIFLDTTIFAIAAIFVISVIAGVKYGVGAVLKLCLLASALAVALTVLFFALSISGFNENAALTFSLPRPSTIAEGVFVYVKRVALPLFVLPLFFSFSLENPSKKAVVVGTAFGYGVLALCLLNSMLVFGTRLAAKFSYPYAQAISIISVGYMFSRMDGFSYFLYFASSLTRATLCVITAKLLLTKAFSE